MAPPSEVKAVVVVNKGVAAVKTVPRAKLRDEYILVRTTAIAINPTDWAHVAGWGSDNNNGLRVGCDYVGVVEEVGSKVTAPFVKGDRIAGMAHGVNKLQPEDGAFGEYIVVKGDVQLKVPDNVTDEEAATLGVGVMTSQALYQTMGLPLPPAEPSSPPAQLLIYGASTATGLLAVQYAKLSGYEVAATCSPSNFDLIRSLGADVVFDYNSPTAVEEIWAWSHGNLTQVLDCISKPDSTRFCVSALSKEKGGHYQGLLFVDDSLVKEVNDKVTNKTKLAYTVIGETIDKGRVIEASVEDFEYGKKFWEVTRKLLAAGKIKPARLEVNRGGKGLEGAIVGMEELKQGKVSGTKLVYTL
ncbi:chaperonin 10-like protein [Bombardia bombarda]|uniref:Chaperonin 10-like protein n=1 Tax=Bombardia bombarda TaxID=252184 RepID=A0AA40C1V7_9PEZI|nr:chaperonin 10-like protein [Bombardia bombarda]